MNLKTKKTKKIIAYALMFSMLSAVFSFSPAVNEARAVDSLTQAKATLSESDISMAATSTFVFTSATSTAIGGYFDVVMTAPFGDVLVGNITCPAGYVGTAFNTETVRCTANPGLVAAGTKTITLANTANPSAAGSQVINIYHYNAVGNLAERAQVVVYIIDNVWMTATVNATLNFTINGVASSTSINGIRCSNDSTSTSTPFGTLVVGATSTVCQRLTVTTNAKYGYTVTVEEDHELLSDNGSNINSFDNAPDNTASTTAKAWTTPNNTLDVKNTYGHMGLTSNDQDLSSYATGYNNFYNAGSPLFAGLASTTPMPVMHHTGPSDGSAANIGESSVLYQAQIASLQEAGDYENNLTYIATPTY